MRRERTFMCADCGETVTRVRSTDDPLICVACGELRVVSTITRQAAEAADRWSISAYVRRHPDSRIATLLREG